MGGNRDAHAPPGIVRLAVLLSRVTGAKSIARPWYCTLTPGA